MILSNFHFLRFAQKGHFQAVKFVLTFFWTDQQTDRLTNLVLEAPFRSLKNFGFLQDATITILWQFLRKEGKGDV